MIDFKSFATDETLEETGVVIALGPKSSIKIARLGNRRFRDLRKIKMRPYEALDRLGQVPEEVQNQIVRELVAETVLLGWTGFTEDGQEVPYTPENALRVLTENKEFLAFVLEQSNNADSFRPAKAETEKNSENASSGN